MRPAGYVQEWRLWWSGLGLAGRWLLAVLAAAFLSLHYAMGGLRGDHVRLVAAALAVYYLGPRLARLWRFLLPLVLVAAIYDAQRYWAAPMRARVRVAEPRAWELAWFGIHGPHGLITPAAWLQARTHPQLDLAAGAAYLLFIPVFLACAAWWYLGRPKPGAIQVMWAMLWLNLAGYATYLLYPAAPPWYADHYGVGPAVLSAAPEPGGGARFDALVGANWFSSVYGRNANVFGAIPSLHVGQTFLALLFALRFRSLRTATASFWLIIFFSSVYLNHHYIVDGLVGMAYAAAAYATEAWGVRRA
jgi:hypothetical protein